MRDLSPMTKGFKSPLRLLITGLWHVHAGMAAGPGPCSYWEPPEAHPSCSPGEGSPSEIPQGSEAFRPHPGRLTSHLSLARKRACLPRPPCASSEKLDWRSGCSPFPGPLWIWRAPSLHYTSSGCQGHHLCSLQGPFCPEVAHTASVNSTRHIKTSDGQSAHPSLVSWLAEPLDRAGPAFDPPFSCHLPQVGRLTEFQEATSCGQI